MSLIIIITRFLFIVGDIKNLILITGVVDFSRYLVIIILRKYAFYEVFSSCNVVHTNSMILYYCQKQTNGNLQFNYDNKKEMLCLNNVKLYRILRC